MSSRHDVVAGRKMGPPRGREWGSNKVFLRFMSPTGFYERQITTKLRFMGISFS